ncbi:MAG: hypothetical protein ACYTF1_01955 [Planctomycetota bacterium]
MSDRSGGYRSGKKGFVLILALLVLANIAVPVFAGEYEDVLSTVWTYQKPEIEDWVLNDPNYGLNNGKTNGIYFVEVYTINLLQYAAYLGDITLLDEISDLYLVPHSHLQNMDQYVYSYLPEMNNYYRSLLPLDPHAWMWVSPYSFTDPDGQTVECYRETILYSSQFLYAVAKAINAILEVPAGQRTANMNSLISSYSNVILTDHYKRWIFNGHGEFGYRGWGCNTGAYNLVDFVVHLHNQDLGTQHLYCNAVCDTHMWIMAGVVEMLAAHEKDPLAVPIDVDYRQDLLAFIDDSSTLLASGMTQKSLTDFNQDPVTGWNFDLGFWDDYYTKAYSGYEGLDFPDPGPPPEGDEIAATDLGWDLGHASRFPHVFGTLYRYRHITGQTFPDSTVMKGLANQFAYGAFNKDLNYPKFSNYMDGTNGWYRVGYNNDPGYGYPPYQLSRMALTGGYGFGAVFNPDVDTIMDRLWGVVDAEDQTYAQEYFYCRIYKNYVQGNGKGFDRTTSKHTLEFLPSWIAKINPDKATNPNPADNKTGVSINSDLSWQGAYAKTYDVYFGTTSPPPFQGNQSQAAFVPETMNYLRQYFWRIDCKNDNGTTTGQIWSFTTGSHPADFDSDGDVDQEDFIEFYACMGGANQPLEDIQSNFSDCPGFIPVASPDSNGKIQYALSTAKY